LTWYELDPNWIGIRTLEMLGLAWDLNVPRLDRAVKRAS
jgi:fatty-acid desaturase